MEEYINVYQQQIDALDGQLETAQAQFEQVSEEKRLRGEQEEAQAAEKAKAAEYDDMRIALDEAKEFEDEARAELKRLEGEIPQDCMDWKHNPLPGTEGDSSTGTETRRRLQGIMEGEMPEACVESVGAW